MSMELLYLMTLSPARWHSESTYLSSLGMLGTAQLNFICRSHNIYNECMKCAHTRQRTSLSRSPQNRHLYHYNNNKTPLSFEWARPVKKSLKRHLSYQGASSNTHVHKIKKNRYFFYILIA